MTTSIIAVDDELDTCQNVADILGEFGYEVDTASSGPVALEKARTKPYEMALLDYRMPAMDGLTTFRLLKREWPKLKAILITAFSDASLCREARQEGFQCILEKPVDMQRLLSILIDDSECFPCQTGQV